MSRVTAVIAVIAGDRAGICMIAVPSPILEVWAPTQVSGTTESEPYASAVHTEWNPSDSAWRATSTTRAASAPQYPRFSPRRMAEDLTPKRLCGDQAEVLDALLDLDRVLLAPVGADEAAADELHTLGRLAEQEVGLGPTREVLMHHQAGAEAVDGHIAGAEDGALGRSAHGDLTGAIAQIEHLRPGAQ